MLYPAFHNCLALCGGTELIKIAHLDRPIESMHNKLGQPPIQIEIIPSQLRQLAGGKHTAADGVAKAQAVPSEPELLQAMFNVGCSRRTRRRLNEGFLLWKDLSRAI